MTSQLLSNARDHLFGSVQENVPGHNERLLDRSHRVAHGLTLNLFQMVHNDIRHVLLRCHNGRVVIGQTGELVQFKRRNDLDRVVVQQNGDALFGFTPLQDGLAAGNH